MRLVPSPTARFVLGSLAAALAATFVTSATASAAAPDAPGDLTGYAFDACVAPSQTVMDAWNVSSPYSIVGIYVSGNSRYCGDRYQPNLSKSWVAKNASNGWGFLPIHVGYQAPCFKNNPQSRVQKKRMSSTQSTARTQGVADAKETIVALQKYGFAKNSVSYLDIEWYARTTACDNAVLAFADGWTDHLHAQGYRSGVYGSGSAVVKLLDEVRAGTKKFSGFTQPDQMWFAWGNNKADVDGGPYLSDAGWKKARIHQFHLDTSERYGGHTVTIDRNYLDVGKGSVATKDERPCGVRMSHLTYPKLSVGSRAPQVQTLQCALKQRGHKKSIDAALGTGTVAAINAYRKTKGWPQNGTTSPAFWTGLLSEGARPRVLKQGDTGASVWRLQRSLRAAGAPIAVNGIYGPATATAVRRLRLDHGLPGYLTVTAGVWDLVQRGRTFR